MTRAVWLCTAVIFTAFAGSVRGQAADPAAALQIPDFVRADLALLTRELALDDDQQIILEALYMDYERAFQDGVGVVQQHLEDPATIQRRFNEKTRATSRVLRENRRRLIDQTDDPDERRKIETAFWKQLNDLHKQRPPIDAERAAGREPVDLDAWVRDREELKQRFLDDLRSLLSDAQRARWPDLERFIRRSKGLRYGRLSGESLNLFHAVARLRLGPSGRDVLAGVLEGYAEELDRALGARDKTLLTRRVDGVRRALTPQRAQVEVDRRRAVRDVNLGYAEAIAERLPAELEAALRIEVDRLAFPRLDHESRGLRLLRAAAALPELDDATRRKVGAMAAEHAERIARANEELRATLLAHEPGQLRFELENGPAAELARDRDPATIAIRNAQYGRRTVDGAAVDALRELLTPEQMDRLARNQ